MSKEDSNRKKNYSNLIPLGGNKFLKKYLKDRPRIGSGVDKFKYKIITIDLNKNK
jgi:hypothetical protein